jgi:hypothetical protein
VEIKVTKLAGFEKRMAEIVSILDHEIVWQKKKEGGAAGGRITNELSRRLFNLSHLTS